jgi:branched-chain amino acid transport system ATP-binding protein
MEKEYLLHLKNIHVHFGGVKALDGASLHLRAGEVVALMGPNGAGKSSILKTIFGLFKRDQGEILWHEKPINPVPYEMVERGISYVPQGRRVFTHLTIEENLEIGGFMVKNKRELERRMNEVFEMFPVLKSRRRQKSGVLSGGQQQMLAIARGLMNNPSVLLLDEPSLGLAPKVVKEVFAKIKEINERHNTAIVVVEHNLKSILEIVDRAYLLDRGAVVAEDSPANLLGSGILEKVFLGKN